MNRYERQKQANRQAILDAALVVFDGKGYQKANVEDIITQAGISRATFYKHFKSKQTVAKALVDQMRSQHDEAYDQLGAIENPSYANIVAWLYLIADINEQGRLLLGVLSELLTAEPALADSPDTLDFDSYRIRRLARSIPAFRHALSHSAGGAAARERVQMLLYEIDAILYRVLVRGWKIDKTNAIHFLAHQIHNFITEAPALVPTRAPDSLSDTAD